MQPRIDEITFNGLDRPAMFAGAPIKPLGMSFLALSLMALLLSLVYGLTAFSLMFLILPIWFCLKLLCEHDENALNIWKYNSISYLAYRFNVVGGGIKSLKKIRFRKNKLFSVPTYLPTSYGSNHYDNE